MQLFAQRLRALLNSTIFKFVILKSIVADQSFALSAIPLTFADLKVILNCWVISIKWVLSTNQEFYKRLITLANLS